MTNTTCLIVTSIFNPIRGGSAVVYENLARFSSGHVAVIAPYRNYQTGRVLVGWLDQDKSANFKVYRMELLRPLQQAVSSPLRSAWLFLSGDIPLRLRILWQLGRIVRREGTKVICLGELDSLSWIGRFAKPLFGCKIINYIHGEEVTTQSRYRFFGRSKRKYLRRADAIVAVSHFTQDHLTEEMGLDEAKIELIYNGVDLDRFTDQTKPQDFLDRYRLSGKKVVLTVGRLIERKGIDRVIEAIPEILISVPNLHYVIVGDGPYKPKLEALVDEVGVRDHVTFTGLVDQDALVAHYGICDLFVLPNRQLPDGDTEGFGLVFLEANACGRPVIAGKAGGTADAVRDGYNGLMVDGNNSEEIAQAIVRILNDPDFYEKLRLGGLEKAQKSDTRARTKQFVDLCERLAS